MYIFNTIINAKPSFRPDFINLKLNAKPRMAKKIIPVLLIVGIWMQGLAQVKTTADTLYRVIDDTQNNPESRVLACVYLGEYYVNKRRKLDSAFSALKLG